MIFFERSYVPSSFPPPKLLALSILLGLSRSGNNGTFVHSLTLPNPIRIRSGFPDDEIAISLVLAKEMMNPMGISHKNNLLVAEDTQTGKQVGWAQIRSLGYAGVTTNPSRFEDDDSGAGKNTLTRRDLQSKLSIEEDVDESIWQEFEDDPTEFPNGMASLPWTKEYRAAFQAAEDRLRRRERMLELERAARPQLWELSSVYVMPKWRRQGIGSALVGHVLKRHATFRQRGKDIYALTLANTVPWYETRFGFVEEKRVPNALAVELNVGRVITKLIGEELVCIRTTL